MTTTETTANQNFTREELNYIKGVLKEARLDTWHSYMHNSGGKIEEIHKNERITKKIVQLENELPPWD